MKNFFGSIIAFLGLVTLAVAQPTPSFSVTANSSGTVVAPSNFIAANNIVVTTNNYANPSWLTSLSWSKVTSTPTNLAGYGITDPVVLTTGSYANPSWITSLSWSKISGTPTTASAYGITNGAALDSIGAAPQTGSGSLVFNNSPALVTPNIGSATATSVNGLKITSTTGTITLASGKTLTTNNTLTLSATDNASLNIGNGGTLGSAAYTAVSAYDVSGAASAVSANSLQKASNLSDLTSASTARTNLGLGSAATQNTSAFDASGAAATAQAASLQKSSNLSDVASVSTARTNLGVTATGSDTTYAYRANNLSDLASASTARTNLGVTATGSDTTYAYRANNLSDLASAATARSNLGLGTAATTNSTAYDAAGAASTAQAYAIQRANHTGTQPASTITGLATSATTDTTNASNITSGTLPNARLSSVPNSALANSSVTVTAGSGLSGGGAVSLGGTVSISANVTSVAGRTGSVTLSSGDISGLAASATTDSTNASNITSGTLPNARLSSVPNSALANSTITIAGNSTALGGSVSQDSITGLSSTGIVKRTAANTLTTATADTDYTTPSGTETLTNKTISGASNTLSNIGNSSLTNSSVSVVAGSGLSGGGSVSLGGSTTLTANVTSVAGRTGAVTISSSDVSGLAASATTDTTNASNITSGTLPNARLSSVPNTALANSSINVIAGSGLSGGGNTSLGSSVTLAANVTSVAGRTGAVTISSSDVSGLAASATTDTTNATNITSGTLPNARLSSIPNSALANSSITFGSTSQALGSTVSAINGVSIGASTASTGSFTTLNSSSQVVFSGAITSTNSTTGALVISNGGLGVSGGIYSTYSNIGNAASSTGIFDVRVTNAATTGVQVVQTIQASSTGTPTDGFGSGINFYNKDLAGNNHVAGQVAAIFKNTGYSNMEGQLVLSSASNGSLYTGLTISPGNGAAGQVSVLAPIASNSTSTGALIVSNGGLGVTGNGNFGGSVNATGFSGAFNGTVGATTPNTGAFTTLTATTSAFVGTTSSFGGTIAQINGANVAQANGAGMVSIGSTDSVAADKGGSLALGAKANGGAATNPYPMAVISGRAANTTDLSGYFSVATSIANGTVAEKFRIDSLGNVGINTTNPAQKLEVNGNAQFDGFIYANVASSNTSWPANANWFDTGIYASSKSSTSSAETGAVAYNFWNSGSPTYSGSFMRFYDSSYSGNWGSSTVPQAGLGALIFQNSTNGLIATNGANSLFFGVYGAVQAYINSNGLGISSTTSSTTTTSGALQVAGGVGVLGNVNAGGAFNQWFTSTNNLTGYSSFNKNNNAYTTNLNGGLLLFQDPNGAFGMDLGYNSGSSRYRTRLFAVNNNDISFAFHTYGTLPTAQSSFTDAVTIRGDSGNVGIGSVSPSYKLTINGGSTTGGDLIRLDSSNGSGTSMAFNSTSTNGRLYRIGSNYVTGAGEFAIYDSTASANRMLISSTGNVGIATTNPAANLQIGTIATNIKYQEYIAGEYNFEGAYLGAFNGNGGASLELVDHTNVSASQSWKIAQDGDVYGGGNLVFAYAPSSSSYSGLSYTPYLNLNSSGNLSLSSTTSSSSNSSGALIVSGGTAIQGLLFNSGGANFGLSGGNTTDPAGSRADGIYLGSSGYLPGSIRQRCAAGASYFGLDSNSGTLFTLFTDNGSIGYVTAGSITLSGGTAAFNTSSDKRLKTPLRPWSLGDKFDEIPLGEYNWLMNGDVGHGTLAQDLYKVYPDAVHVGSDKRDDKGNLTEPWSVDYGKLTVPLIAEVKSLRSRVKTLEQEQADTQKQLNDLTAKFNQYITTHP